MNLSTLNGPNDADTIASYDPEPDAYERILYEASTAELSDLARVLELTILSSDIRLPREKDMLDDVAEELQSRSPLFEALTLAHNERMKDDLMLRAVYGG